MMRQITTRYDGECRKCGAVLEVGQSVMYEKSMGIFCVGCEPTEVEDIRHYRTLKAEAKADRREEWARKARARSNSLSAESSRMTSIIPMGQPILVGHYSESRDRNYRERAWNKMGRAVEEQKKADEHEAKAENLRRVRVKGDADRKYQAMSDANDKVIKVGSVVYSHIAGCEGVVLKVFKKSYRVKYNRGFTWTDKKHFVKLVKNPA